MAENTLSDEQLDAEFDSILSEDSQQSDDKLESFTSNNRKSQLDTSSIKVADLINISPRTAKQRLEDGFATDEGKELNAVNRFGRDNVARMPDGEIIVRAKDEDGMQKWARNDPSGFNLSETLGDAADVVGFIPEVVLSAVGLSTAGPFGAAAGAATGDAAKRIIGKVLGFRPDEDGIDAASGVAFSALLNGAFAAIPTTQIAKNIKAPLAKIITSMNKKVNSSLTEPLIGQLTKMKDVFLKRGIGNPEKVLSKANMADDAIGKLVSEIEGVKKNISQKAFTDFGKGKKSLVKKHSDLKLGVNQFKDELLTLTDQFKNALGPNKKLATSRKNAINKLIEDITTEPKTSSILMADGSKRAIKKGSKREFISLSEAMDIKKDMGRMIDDAVFNSDAQLSQFAKAQKDFIIKLDGSIRGGLGNSPDSLALYNDINKKWALNVGLKKKLKPSAVTESKDKIRSYLTKVSALEENGAVYKNLGERNDFLKEVDSVFGTKMLDRVDDVFTGQEWAKKQSRLKGLIRESFFPAATAGGATAAASGSPIAGASAFGAILGGGISLQDLARTPELARFLRGKQAIASVIQRASKATSPAIASEIIQRSRDKEGNEFPSEIKAYIASQAKNGVTDKAIAGTVAVVDLKQKLQNQEKIRKRIRKVSLSR